MCGEIKYTATRLHAYHAHLDGKRKFQKSCIVISLSPLRTAVGGAIYWRLPHEGHWDLYSTLPLAMAIEILCMLIPQPKAPLQVHVAHPPQRWWCSSRPLDGNILAVSLLLSLGPTLRAFLPQVLVHLFVHSAFHAPKV